MKWQLPALLAIGALLGGCGGEAPSSAPQQESASMETISGQALYRERILLTPGTTMLVVLEDVSKADAMAEVISEQRFEVQGPPPFAFALQYDPAKLVENHRYGLRIRIEEKGELRFINDYHIDPFGDGLDQIVLKGVGR
ncbi:YbaY family lipoprotein [Ferrimonas balearica]|uniref:YbaY family lipoprotein n=1 Tax=Ferrimonas balearica TaxID=44012 RepID=UPI001F35505E|nr:YbaY family lipoprotein [Ferrimonas balearica]MBY6019318.1 YbaY family lipoprotein [Halomonas denitrificans]MBY6096324.1 YbaY family lipoprotein [Ferrimonas balearica]